MTREPAIKSKKAISRNAVVNKKISSLPFEVGIPDQASSTNITNQSTGLNFNSASVNSALDGASGSNLTYAKLASVKPSRISDSSYPVYVSALRKFRIYFNRAETDLATLDFGLDFELKLESYLSARNAKTPSARRSAASRIRAWHKTFLILNSTAIKNNFKSTLNNLISQSKMSKEAIARASGISLSTLDNWSLRTGQPRSLATVTNIENTLGAEEGTLTNLLLEQRHKIFNYIPDNWWPEDILNSNSFYASQRRIYNLMGQHTQILGTEQILQRFNNALDIIRKDADLLEYRRLCNIVRKKPYYYFKRDWSAKLVEEWQKIVDFKTKTFIFGGSVVPSPRWKSSTADKSLMSVQKFFGYLMLRADEVDGQLRGCGLTTAELTFGYYASEHHLNGYINFRVARIGYSQDTEVIIKYFAMMLKPTTGYLWHSPHLKDQLPEPIQQEIDAAGGWQLHCEQLRLKILKNLKELKQQNPDALIPARDSFLAIDPILSSPRPLNIMQQALRKQYNGLMALRKSKEYISARLASQFRDHLFISLLCAWPLREKHWRLMTYRTDNQGTLRKHPSDGWQLVIPYSEFKNCANKEIFPSSRGRNQVVTTFSGDPVLERLIPILEQYLRDYRPLLCPGDGPLFPSSTRSSPPFHPSERVRRWSEQYIIEPSSRSLGLVGVHSFRAHAVRDIVATHIIKQPLGTIQSAADALLDSVRVTAKHYARFLPEDRGRQARHFMTGDGDADE